MDIEKHMGKLLEFKYAGENCMDKDLALKLEFVYGDYIHNPEFIPYLKTLPDLFKLYEFEMAYHPFFGMFLEGLPKLIAIMGEEVD